MKHSLLLLTPILLLVLTSCQYDPTTSVQRRIEKHPGMFEQLSEAHKDLVVVGEIAEGMRKDAVFLAWGPANSAAKGQRDGQDTETWYYGGAYDRGAYYRPYWSFGAGPGYGGGFDFGYYGGYHNDPLYVRDFYYDRAEPSAWVTFSKDNKVIAWEAEL